MITDRITSPTGSLLPAAAIAAAARAVGALTFVDAAHVPGHVEARPAASGADFWTGTWHKWGFAPRGASVLWVTEAERDGVVPLTTSWNHQMPFPLPFDTYGTDDYTCWYSLAAAVDFWRDAGGLELAAHGPGSCSTPVPPWSTTRSAGPGCPVRPSGCPPSRRPACGWSPCPTASPTTRTRSTRCTSRSATRRSRRRSWRTAAAAGSG